MMRKVHELKIGPKYFDDVESGVKPFEVRLNDRDYKVGDILQLKEWTQSGYTGRETVKIVTYVMDDSNYCPDGYMILGLNLEDTGGWTPCSERLPEPGLINPNTMDYQQYMCLVEFNDIQDARSLMLDKHGDWINGGVNMTDYVIAWQPLPEPYRG